MKVKLWNDGPFDWEEEYKGEIYKIPKGGYIEVERSRAVKIQSQFSHFSREGNIRQQNPKMLRIEIDPEKWAEHNDQPLRFVASDGKKFRTVQGVENYEKSITVGGETSGSRKRRSG